MKVVLMDQLADCMHLTTVLDLTMLGLRWSCIDRRANLPSGSYRLYLVVFTEIWYAGSMSAVGYFGRAERALRWRIHMVTISNAALEKLKLAQAIAPLKLSLQHQSPPSVRIVPPK